MAVIPLLPGRVAHLAGRENPLLSLTPDYVPFHPHSITLRGDIAPGRRRCPTSCGRGQKDVESIVGRLQLLQSLARGMKMRKPSHLMVIAAGSLLLAACAPRLIPTSTQEANDAQIAKETLLRFLSDLHERGY